MTDRFDVALAMSEWFKVNDDKPRLRAGNTSANHIYVIGDSLLPTVKIGITGNIRSRLSALRHQSGRAGLSVLFSYDCGSQARAVEREVHRRLCRGRVLGEWFEAAPADVIDALTEAIKQVLWQARNEHKANDRQGAQGEQQAADQTAA